MCSACAVGHQSDRGQRPAGSWAQPRIVVAEHGLTSPFLLLGSDSKDACTAAADPSCAAVLQHSTGWHAAITLPGTEHGSFTDAETLIPRLAAEDPTIPRSAVTGDVGTADPRVVTAVQETIVSGFFGATLR